MTGAAFPVAESVGLTETTIDDLSFSPLSFNGGKDTSNVYCIKNTFLTLVMLCDYW